MARAWTLAVAGSSAATVVAQEARANEHLERARAALVQVELEAASRSLELAPRGRRQWPGRAGRDLPARRPGRRGAG